MVIEEPGLSSRAKSIEYTPDENGCWNVSNLYLKDGYTKVFRGGSRTKTHRYIYALFVDTIPRGMCVLHRCDNPRCINPEHLWLGTQKDNAIDRESKSRGVDNSGKNNGRYSHGKYVRGSLDA